jgi:hypothetical protein
VFLLGCVSAFLLVPWLGQDFFPNTDSGAFILHMRAKTGARIKETARIADQVETAVRQIVPPREMDTILDNIGLPCSGINLTQGLRMKFCWVVDGMESGVIRGVTLKLGNLHVGEEVGRRIHDPGRSTLRRQGRAPVD